MNITLTNLRKYFGDKLAVDIPTFTVNNGDMLGLVGNNGAGKTTLFRLMLDLLKAEEGVVTMTSADGIEINPSENEEWKSFTGAYIDEGFLIDYLTPDEYFDFIARVSKMEDADYHGQLLRYLPFMAGEVIGQKKFIRDLSAGNKQKVGIVAALITRPKLLILDEPFNFLDPTSQYQLKQIITEYHADTQATILISSHNIDHTTDISTRIALMEHGAILKDIDNRNKEALPVLEQYFNVDN